MFTNSAVLIFSIIDKLLPILTHNLSISQTYLKKRIHSVSSSPVQSRMHKSKFFFPDRMQHQDCAGNIWSWGGRKTAITSKIVAKDPNVGHQLVVVKQKLRLWDHKELLEAILTTISNIFKSDEKHLNESSKRSEKMVKRADVTPVEDGFLPLDGRISSLTASRWNQKSIFINGIELRVE